jgi:hypothetical protein
MLPESKVNRLVSGSLIWNQRWPQFLISLGDESPDQVAHPGDLMHKRLKAARVFTAQMTLPTTPDLMLPLEIRNPAVIVQLS